MNPSATQQHHARSMMHWMQARASRLPTYNNVLLLQLPSFLLPTSFSGGGRRQHFSHKQRLDGGRFPRAHLYISSRGGLLWCLSTIDTPTNRDSSVS